MALKSSELSPLPVYPYRLGTRRGYDCIVLTHLPPVAAYFVFVEKCGNTHLHFAFGLQTSSSLQHVVFVACLHALVLHSQ
uniref:Uncharacterized protein n=1 Tax=Pyxicephalus adspersus TaxID=30357 RepID=A0AAV3A611_PYXAD|nr:TPA: hypothetical protein GDO54_012999 [Pyxicephalus adspersus]